MLWIMAKTQGVAYWSKKLIGTGGVLNEYVKWRDAIQVVDGKPICPCITCGKLVSGTNLHAGHWISRVHKATAYDEYNIASQCGYPCNKFRNGEPQVYEAKLRALYGDVKVDEMKSTIGTLRKWKPYELEELYNYYKSALAEIKGVRQ
jgi:hypothetical protein